MLPTKNSNLLDDLVHQLEYHIEPRSLFIKDPFPFCTDSLYNYATERAGLFAEFIPYENVENGLHCLNSLMVNH